MPQRSQAGVNGMQKPELRDLPRGHSSLKCSAGLLLFLSNDGALLFQNLDQALQHGSQALTATQMQASWNMGGIVDEVTRLIPHDARDGDRQKAFLCDGQYHQPDILTPQLYCLGVESGVLVVHHFNRTGV